MKIATLKVSARFTDESRDVEYEDGFDEDALEDGPGQALLVYGNGGWELYTSDEVYQAGADGSSHGSLPGTDLAEAVTWARQRLQDKGYEVAFRLGGEDQG
jgi:hypothetical protein